MRIHLHRFITRYFESCSYVGVICIKLSPKLIEVKCNVTYGNQDFITGSLYACFPIIFWSLHRLLQWSTTPKAPQRFHICPDWGFRSFLWKMDSLIDLQHDWMETETWGCQKKKQKNTWLVSLVGMGELSVRYQPPLWHYKAHAFWKVDKINDTTGWIFIFLGRGVLS